MAQLCQGGGTAVTVGVNSYINCLFLLLIVLFNKLTIGPDKYLFH
ncbi:hypothetical protein [Bacteroides reticulotermitis]|nr:hypothetical protein [Bacteroides reticulotermitis]